MKVSPLSGYGTVDGCFLRGVCEKSTGRTYIRWQREAAAGDILSTTWNEHPHTSVATSGHGITIYNFRVLQAVSSNAVIELMRKYGKVFKIEPGGFWYEVHGD